MKIWDIVRRGQRIKDDVSRASYLLCILNYDNYECISKIVRVSILFTMI